MSDKTKYIPAVMSLSAGLVTSIIALTSHYDTLHFMIAILVSLLVFYVAGIIVRSVCVKNFVIKEAENEENDAEEDDGSTQDGGENENTEEQTDDDTVNDRTE